jgi:bifunctional UDP-N-acetylglucosamine pyrophosphorylase/glucosamine-1-phosphate N-acetyltransferase
VVREDVPPGALAVSGGQQRNIEGWVGRKRPGSAAAQAAEQARAGDDAERSDGEERRRSTPAGDDAERSDGEEQT